MRADPWAGAPHGCGYVPREFLWLFPSAPDLDASTDLLRSVSTKAGGDA